MKKITSEDREGLNACLGFITDELGQREGSIMGGHSGADRFNERENFLKDLHAYACTRKLAKDASVDTREYDSRIDGMTSRLFRLGLFEESELNYRSMLKK